MVQEHLNARFRADLPAAGLPRAFAIVTAFNPDGKVRPDADNAADDARLRAELERDGLAPFRVTGGSRDGAHREPGWGFAAPSAADARARARRFRQLALYWVEDGTIFLLDSEAGPRIYASTWAARRADW